MAEQRRYRCRPTQQIHLGTKVIVMNHEHYLFHFVPNLLARCDW